VCLALLPARTGGNRRALDRLHRGHLGGARVRARTLPLPVVSARSRPVAGCRPGRRAPVRLRPAAFIPADARADSTAASTLTACTWRHSPVVTVAPSLAGKIPALLTRMPQPPDRSRTMPVTAPVWAGRLMARASAGSPPLSARFFVAASGSQMSAATTLAPPAASRRQYPSPMPRPGDQREDRLLPQARSRWPVA
jgi:hypothetical protein